MCKKNKKKVQRNWNLTWNGRRLFNTGDHDWWLINHCTPQDSCGRWQPATVDPNLLVLWENCLSCVWQGVCGLSLYLSVTLVVASVVLSYSCLNRDFKRKIAQTNFGVEFVVCVLICYFDMKMYMCSSPCKQMRYNFYSNIFVCVLIHLYCFIVRSWSMCTF